MSMTDPIADMLTRVRNAIMRKHKTVSIPHSGTKEAIAGILKSEGFIEDFQVLPQQPQMVLNVTLKYASEHRTQRSIITGLERVSKPGRRVYVGKGDIPWVLSGMGIAILTTSKGVVTGDKARELGVGGEVLCKVW